VNAAQSVLLEHGLFGAELTAEGPQGEIAALRVPASQWERMMSDDSEALVAAIRALGFRYVALDLQPAEG
jgi:hypothetical protein